MTTNAREEFLQLLAQEPGNAEHHQRFGKFLIKQNDLGLAEKYLKRSLELDCEDPWTFMYLGNLNHALQKYEAALAFFELASSELPDIAVTYWCIAEMHEELENYELADSFFHKAVEVEPDDETAIRKLAEWKALFVKH